MPQATHIKPMNKVIGNNLKKFRDANGLTQENIAEYLGIGRSAYSNYESGEREMPLALLEKAADLLGCDLDLLLEENAETVGNMLTCAFRMDNMSVVDMQQIARFKEIVKNYLKMNRLIASHECK